MGRGRQPLSNQQQGDRSKLRMRVAMYPERLPAMVVDAPNQCEPRPLGGRDLASVDVNDFVEERQMDQTVRSVTEAVMARLRDKK